LSNLTSKDIINYTDLRSNLKHWLDKVINDVSELIIERKNHKDLIFISLGEYNSLRKTTYLLKGAKTKILLDFIKELENSKVVEK